ncbi:MAG: molybdopterin dinucleotide binding domain-containing protein [Parasutterella excrementihominis]
MPDVTIIDDPLNPVTEPGDPAYPTVMTTYHMVEHWISGSMTRTIPWLVGLQPRSFIEISPELAESIGVTTGSYVSVRSPRNELQVRALVTPRLRIGVIEGRQASIAGRFVCSGYKGIVCDPITNDLSPADMAGDGLIPSSKSFVVKIGKPDLSKVEKFQEDPVKYPGAMSEPVPDTPWAAQPEEGNYEIHRFQKYF